MIKQIFLLILLISTKIGFGQLLYNITIFQKNILYQNDSINIDSCYTLSKLDSLYANRKKLCDKEYVICYDSLKKTPIYRIFLSKGNINGVFCHYNKQGFLRTIGSYKNDSLWTFRGILVDIEDTTFRIGRWSHYGRFKYAYEKGYYWQHISNDLYKIPFDSNGVYIEDWFHYGGKLWQHREYKKGLGLVLENQFDYKGNPFSSFEKIKNTTISKEWDDNGNLKSITINDKMEYWISLRERETFSDYKLNDTENKREELINPKGENFQTRLFYPNGNLMEFYDNKAGIKIKYDENGEVILVEKRKGVKVKKMIK